MSKPIIISIEGNIGSGKSTILEKLQDFMKDNNRIVFLKEPERGRFDPKRDFESEEKSSEVKKNKVLAAI
jgi:thymidylate kinase